MFKPLAAESIRQIDSGAVISTYGTAGMGKTSLLHYLDSKLPKSRYVTVFLDFREIATRAEFMAVMHRRLAAAGGLLAKIQDAFTGSNKTLVERINTALGKRQLVLLIDEAGLLRDGEIASLLATIKDRTHSAIVTTSIEPLSSYEAYKGSFREGRVAKQVQFPLPSDEELREMVRERIESVGGSRIYPFGRDALDYIARISGNIPREVLINCQNASMYYVDESLNRELTRADLEILLTGKAIQGGEDEDLQRIFDNLSENQQQIIRAMVRPKTAQELEKELGITYGSLTKELGRLMLQTDVEMMNRKGLKHPVCTRTENRPFQYVLTKKWRLLITKE
ncbi:MAG: ATP-binding protein [Candidatus Micrarchaeota archaeon]|nr:ATP-binding protein [Candidatus Micrarchaeota archaeon]